MSHETHTFDLAHEKGYASRTAHISELRTTYIEIYKRTESCVTDWSYMDMSHEPHTTEPRTTYIWATNHIHMSHEPHTSNTSKSTHESCVAN